MKGVAPGKHLKIKRVFHRMLLYHVSVAVKGLQSESIAYHIYTLFPQQVYVWGGVPLKRNVLKSSEKVCQGWGLGCECSLARLCILDHPSGHVH